MTPECLPQKVLRSGVTPEWLLQNYAIKHKRHGRYPNLVQLKYDQINADFSEPLVQQCRGIILDEANSWEIVARPFDKFFNHAEAHAAEIDWGSSRPLEKLDGSLMILYWYDGAWLVATSGTPDASGPVNETCQTFETLFWSTWTEMGYSTEKLVPGLTYMFELMTPANRVVVRHKSRSLVLIGAREVDGGEHDIEADGFHQMFQVVRAAPLADLGAILETFETMDPLSQEGYVVVDARFHRIKVKHPGYVALHQMKDGCGPKRFLDTVRRGEALEILAHFPEWAPEFERIQKAYDGLVLHLDEAFARIKDIPSQKDFAQEALKTRYSSALFLKRSGKVQTIKEALATMNLRTLMDLLNLRDVELSEAA